jgi:hypothetical protein
MLVSVLHWVQIDTYSPFLIVWLTGTARAPASRTTRKRLVDCVLQSEKEKATKKDSGACGNSLRNAPSASKGENIIYKYLSAYLCLNAGQSIPRPSREKQAPPANLSSGSDSESEPEDAQSRSATKTTGKGRTVTHRASQKCEFEYHSIQFSEL